MTLADRQFLTTSIHTEMSAIFKITFEFTDEAGKNVCNVKTRSKESSWLAAPASSATNARNKMKKILLLRSLFLIFSCSELQKWQKKVTTIFKEKSKKEGLNKEEPKKADLIVTEEFVSGSEDIPLLAGMQKISDGSLGFDSTVGSIISSSYSSNLDHNEVKIFYLKTLPKMGWGVVRNSIDSAKFRRDKEDLEIEFAEENGVKLVRFFYSSLTE